MEHSTQPITQANSHPDSTCRQPDATPCKPVSQAAPAGQGQRPTRTLHSACTSIAQIQTSRIGNSNMPSTMNYTTPPANMVIQNCSDVNIHSYSRLALMRQSCWQHSSVSLIQASHQPQGQIRIRVEQHRFHKIRAARWHTPSKLALHNTAMCTTLS